MGVNEASTSGQLRMKKIGLNELIRLNQVHF